MHGHDLGSPELGDEPGEHGPIALVDRSDRDLRLVHPVIMQAARVRERLEAAGSAAAAGSRPGYIAGTGRDVITPARWAGGIHACTESLRAPHGGVHLHPP